jgi:hypothetical protein
MNDTSKTPDRPAAVRRLLVPGTLSDLGRTRYDTGCLAPIRDRGQATTEYALVLLAAALVGLLVVGWATSGGGAAAVGKLFEHVIDSVIDKT